MENAALRQGLSSLLAGAFPSGAPAVGEPAESGKIAALEARVRKLEGLLDQLLADRTPSDEDDAPMMTHDKWIEAHRDVLRTYPDSFVALDPDEGIVVHASDGDEFSTRLGKLSPEQRDRVLLFHTSMYV